MKICGGLINISTGTDGKIGHIFEEKCVRVFLRDLSFPGIVNSINHTILVIYMSLSYFHSKF